MVLTTPIVLTHGVVAELLNHTRTRGPSVAHIWDFLELKRYFLVETESYVAICLHLIGFYPHFGCISRRALVFLVKSVMPSVTGQNHFKYLHLCL